MSPPVTWACTSPGSCSRSASRTASLATSRAPATAATSCRCLRVPQPNHSIDAGRGDCLPSGLNATALPDGLAARWSDQRWKVVRPVECG